MQAVPESGDGERKGSASLPVSRWFSRFTSAYVIVGVATRCVTDFSWKDAPFYFVVTAMALIMLKADTIIQNQSQVIEYQLDTIRHQSQVLEDHHEFVLELHELNIKTMSGRINLEHMGWGIQREEGFELLPIKRDDMPPVGAEPIYRLPTASKTTW